MLKTELTDRLTKLLKEKKPAMSKIEQTDRLTKLLKPDVVIDLGKKVVTPFNLLEIQTQLDQLSVASAIEAAVEAGKLMMEG